MDSRLRLKLDSPHPDDGSVAFEDRPSCSLRPGNLHSFKSFLNFSRTAGMTQANAIPRLPRAQHGFQREAGWGVFAGD